MIATCQCGQLKAHLPGPAEAIVACHCLACQRRSGSPFGVIAYYPQAQVQLSGEASLFVRLADSGTPFETGFCPICGTTVHVRTGRHPESIGIPIGTFADPAYPAPVRSVWEETKHGWVVIPGDIQHFPRGRN
ncbi:GFA family protein [Sandaracinobacter neustonicus]|uniref:GFA family protein n=1 Tax=Sandaracinobacter neustonicus TaxID=1715348 RepID=A0A501XJ71_9SPHN|nr:GFA family protein [Sandaracinobacter neustonicus]